MPLITRRRVTVTSSYYADGTRYYLVSWTGNHGYVSWSEYKNITDVLRKVEYKLQHHDIGEK